MNDRELLELAAKAAGYLFIECNDGSRVRGSGLLLANWTYWNPLTDDGDALRLAVKLGLDIMRTEADVEALAGLLPHVKIDAHTVSAPFAIEALGNAPHAATRRAIVRAAAEIGRAMP